MGLHGGWKMLEEISPEALSAGVVARLPTDTSCVVVQDTLVRLQRACARAKKQRATASGGVWRRLALDLVLEPLRTLRANALVLVADKPALVTPLKHATQQKRRARSAAPELPAGVSVAADEGLLDAGGQPLPNAFVEDLIGSRHCRPLLLRHVQDILLNNAPAIVAALKAQGRPGSRLVLDLGFGVHSLAPDDGGDWAWRAGPEEPVAEGEADLGVFRWIQRWHGRCAGWHYVADTIDTDFLVLGLMVANAQSGLELFVNFQQKFLLHVNPVLNAVCKNPGGLAAFLRALCLHGTDFLDKSAVCPSVHCRSLLAVQEDRARTSLSLTTKEFVHDICAAYIHKSRKSVPAESKLSTEWLHEQTKYLNKRLPALATLERSAETYNLQIQYWSSVLEPEPPAQKKRRLR